jgi:hypothetical protein
VIVARALLWVTVATALACAPRLRPLPGTPVTVDLPRTDLAAGHRRIVFRWELVDADLVARGEGAARVASPDSARLDFFLGGGVGGGAAILVGDRLVLPPNANDMSERLVPPASLLWASLGRLAIGKTDRVSAASSGQTLQADVGNPVVWRVTFIRDTLVRLERVDHDRVLEWVERSSDGRSVRYKHETQRRALELVITSNTAVGAFDPAIWSFP